MDNFMAGFLTAFLIGLMVFLFITERTYKEDEGTVDPRDTVDTQEQ